MTIPDEFHDHVRGTADHHERIVLGILLMNPERLPIGLDTEDFVDDRNGRARQ